MNQSVYHPHHPHHDLSRPDGLYPLSFPHPHPASLASEGETSAPTPTPSPPPPAATTLSVPSSEASGAAKEKVSPHGSPENLLPGSHHQHPACLQSAAPRDLLRSAQNQAVLHQSLLQAAVQSGDSSGLVRLLEGRECHVNLNAPDGDGQTALHHSCQRGDLQLVKVLVRHGADVRLANRDGWTAVHIAAFGGHTDVLLYLMTAGAVACRRS